MQRSITLNLMHGYAPQPILRVSQYDHGYTVSATIRNGVESYSIPDDFAVTVEGRKPDQTGYQYNCSFDGDTVTFTVEDQMSVLSGKSVAEVVLYSDGVRAGTANFMICVEPAPLNSDVPISETDIPLIEQAAENAARAERGASLAEASATSAASSAAIASDAATSASGSASSASQSATAAAESADEAEEWADKAEQAAATKGYIWFYIEDGKLYMDRSDTTEVTFYLENGKLYVEEVTQ